VVLVLENPLAGDDVSAGRSRNKPPGAIVDERLVLLNHRSATIWIGEGAAIGSRERGGVKREAWSSPRAPDDLAVAVRSRSRTGSPPETGRADAQKEPEVA